LREEINKKENELRAKVAELSTEQADHTKTKEDLKAKSE